MSISLIVSGAGAVVAAVGLVMLLVRSARTPRGDLIAWAVALLGLLVSLGAQAAGHAAGFSGLTFRLMETGGQVIAPMALIMGLSEAVARSMPGRFAGRLLIPAFTIIPLVVFTTDPLSGTAFSTAWPPPATYYQLIPNKLLEFGLAPATVIVALVTAGIAVRRSRREFAWRAALLPVLAAAAAVLLLALPGLAPALRDHAGLKLPMAALFAVLGLAAAVLAGYAGIGTASVPVDALRDAGLRSGDDRGRYARAPRPGEGRGGGSHLPQAYDPYQEDYGNGAPRGPYESQGYGHGPYEDDYSRRGYGRDGDAGLGDTGLGDTGVYDNAAYDSAIYDSGSHDDAAARWAAIDQTGDLEAYRDGGTGGGQIREPDSGYAGPRTGDVAAPQVHGQPGDGPQGPGLAGAGSSAEAEPDGDGREELFGQIAIYTLIEDMTDEFDRLTEQVVTQVRSGEPSTLVYIVHAVPSAPMQRILYEVYRDRAAYEQHQRQPYVAQFEADRRPYVLATNVIELGLQHAKVSPFPSIADLFGEPGYDTSGFERPDFTREFGSTVGRPAAGGVALDGAAGPAAGRASHRRAGAGPDGR
jgi:quinol monooxygenase YgiN